MVLKGVRRIAKSRYAHSRNLQPDVESIDLSTSGEGLGWLVKECLRYETLYTAEVPKH